jgi:hypothetical protein
MAVMKKKKAKAGEHMMPDGKMMKDSEMKKKKKMMKKKMGY